MPSTATRWVERTSSRRGVCVRGLNGGGRVPGAAVERSSRGGGWIGIIAGSGVDATLGTSAGAGLQAHGGSSLGLYPYAFEVLNYGGGYIHDKVAGLVYDARDEAQSLGQVTVQAASAAGVFAYPPTTATPQAVLPNLSPLSGEPSSYQTVVAADRRAHV